MQDGLSLEAVIRKPLRSYARITAAEMKMMSLQLSSFARSNIHSNLKRSIAAVAGST